VGAVDSISFTAPRGFAAVVVDGLRPEDAGDEAVGDALRGALWTHGVVVVRQTAPLADAEARAIASMIGPIKDPVGRARDGTMLRYAEDRQVMDSGFVLTDELREQLGGVSFGGDRDRPGLFQAFHTDDTFAERPAAASVLHARQLPAGPGGNTRFLDMRAAYRLLEPATKQRIAGKRVVYAYDNGGAFPPRPPSTGPASGLADVEHPLVRSHPVTGEPALYLDLDRATHVRGMSVSEGRALLQALQGHAEEQAPHYGHTWRPHDVLMWDNASVQHAAAGDFPVGEPRRFWRYLIEGSVPA
jgi:alpha-ketoglutarate-dependent taurine dioxygenase